MRRKGVKVLIAASMADLISSLVMEEVVVAEIERIVMVTFVYRILWVNCVLGIGDYDVFIAFRIQVCGGSAT